MCKTLFAGALALLILTGTASAMGGTPATMTAAEEAKVAQLTKQQGAKHMKSQGKVGEHKALNRVNKTPLPKARPADAPKTPQAVDKFGPKPPLWKRLLNRLMH